MDSAGNSDKLVSTDGVTIQNGASVHVTPETAGENGSTYNLNTTYTVVSASQGVLGTFNSVTDDFRIPRCPARLRPQ